MKKTTHKAKYPKATPTADYSNRLDIGTMSVDDPFEPGKKCDAQVNIRHDVLIHWRSRKQIDEAQFLAGQRLQTIWYQASIGMPSSVQYGRERVDVSGGADPFPERVAAASGELRNIAAFLGQADYRLAIRILCEGRKIEHIARDLGGREPQLYVARRVRDALGFLAEYWGAKGKSSVPIRMMTMASPF